MAIRDANPGVLLMVECGYKFRFFGEDAEVGCSSASVSTCVCMPCATVRDEETDRQTDRDGQTDRQTDSQTARQREREKEREREGGREGGREGEREGEREREREGGGGRGRDERKRDK